ncbi:MAG: glycine--tRNA ligase [Candidatus Delongbacteria bacterium]|jgi:glycyl-tRNA synthetase|nr:glycine--tRNA ligase [Candidatus Delongbacteria bacterium]
MSEETLEKIVSLAKRRGFVYPGSEIYGGLANTWDYGPLGIELINNIKNAWRRKFITERTDVVELDSAILLNPKVWEASGHVGGFSDPLMDCKKCNTRVRADKLIEEWNEEKNTEIFPENWAGEHTPTEDLFKFINTNKIVCPKCGKIDWTEPKAFNLMFKTEQGVIEGEGAQIYLRPETAQGIFINFKNIQTTSRKKIPFGICQIGKSFRNEITPGNFIFRTREFEQMEMEFFCKPGTEIDWFNYWKDFTYKWFLSLGVKEENLRMRDHEADELAFYSNATTDVEYKYPFGWSELCGIASRTDYDLKQHIEFSGKDLSYFDEAAKEKYVPFVIEPSLGVQRTALIVLNDAYTEEEIKENDTRIVLKLHHTLAPFKMAVLPLSKKLGDDARKVFDLLVQKLGWNIDLDMIGSIGKRYRRQDEIGTPYCITFDFDSLEDNSVTVRDRDTMEQERIKIDDLFHYFINKFMA